MSIAHAVAFVNMFFISIFCPRLCLFAEYASPVKEVIFPVMRGFFGRCGLTKRGDSDKMIKENKASERSTPPFFIIRSLADWRMSYEINLAHTGRSAL